MTLEMILDALAARPPAALVPQGVYDPALSAAIQACECAETMKAGLLLWNDDLEPSHQLLQSIGSATGSYWHAILHRREPDYSNSKYWFNRTGQHPALATIAALAAPSFPDAPWLSQGKYDPFAFVDACEAAAKNKTDPTPLQAFQALEIRALLDHSRKE